jgi:hypothetical protein
MKKRRLHAAAHNVTVSQTSLISETQASHFLSHKKKSLFTKVALQPTLIDIKTALNSYNNLVSK